MAQEDIKRIGVRIEGRVQGVGFRWFVLREAQRMGLAGWVRNADDGAVEVRAEGPAAAIARFELQLEQGPPAAQVTQLTQLPENNELLPATFEIAR